MEKYGKFGYLLCGILALFAVGIAYISGPNFAPTFIIMLAGVIGLITTFWTDDHGENT